MVIFCGKRLSFVPLYDHVRELEENKIDFSMDTSSLDDVDESWPGAAFSITLLIFHGIIIGSILIVMLVI